jgi:hypothetical protein
MRKAWFRHKSIGVGVTPVSWEGWLCILALLAIVVPTMLLLGDPWLAKPGTAQGLARLRAQLGLGGVQVPIAARFALLAAELVAFLAFARTRTAPDLP